MKEATAGALLVVIGLAAGLSACAERTTGPEQTPPPSLTVVGTDIPGDGAPFPTAVVLAGSSCSLGKRSEMKANLSWQVSGSTPVKSVLLWLERGDGTERQLTRKVLGSPRMSGVAAGFEYQKYGPWVRARLELYDGAPDYTAPRTTIVVPCS